MIFLTLLFPAIAWLAWDTFPRLAHLCAAITLIIILFVAYALGQ